MILNNTYNNEKINIIIKTRIKKVCAYLLYKVIYMILKKKVSGTNVTVYKQTYNINELYKNRGSDYIRISLPDMY